MASAEMKILSGSANGKPLRITPTSGIGSGVLVHATAATAGIVHLIHISAVNTHTAAVLLTIEGGAPLEENQFTVTLQPDLPVDLPTLALDPGQTVTAFAATSNVVRLWGYVNEVTN